MKKLIFTFLFSIYLTFGAETTILAPATPSSIPLILAAQNNNSLKVNLFQEHSKAHSKFLQGKSDILVTGLTVGKKFYDQKIPVKIANTFVSELSYLVSLEKKLDGFADLKDKNIYLPFKGAPLTEITQYFAQQENLKWKKDISPKYSPFPSTVKLLLRGKAQHAVLPEPFVSNIISKNKNIYISFSYTTLWNEYSGEKDGFPQVATFYKSDNESVTPQTINLINNRLDRSIKFIQSHPDSAIKEVKDRFKFSASILKNSLDRTGFKLYTGKKLKHEIEEYYQKIESPLDKTYKEFFHNYKK